MANKSHSKPFQPEGVTTRAMQEAPLGAFYLWVNGSTDYPRQLMRMLDRTDLRLITPSFLLAGAAKLRATTRPLVVDHAFRFTAQHLNEQVHTTIAEHIRKYGGSMLQHY